MRLDRNNHPDGHGKYALLKLRTLNDMRDAADPFHALPAKIAEAIKTLEDAGAIEWGNAGTEHEFFVIKLRDKYASHALAHYASAAKEDDPEYARDVAGLALRAGGNSSFCKNPD